MESENELLSRNRIHKKPVKLCAFLPIDIYPWLVLLTICWITFGSYWVFDTPGAIQTQITAWFGGPAMYTSADNLLLYSIYSFPNMILAFFGGIIIDRFLGVRIGTLVFCSFVFLGNILVSLGIQFRLYWLCVLGRLVFGLGGESLTVGQNYYTARWFDGRILSLAFGIVLAFSRIGSSVNFAVTPLLANTGVPFSVWFGTLMCLVSLVACVYLTFLDWYGDSRVRKSENQEVISIKHIKEFPLQAWFIFLICCFFYISVLTFYTVASDIMQHTGKKFDADSATFFLFIPNFVAIPASPTFGMLNDRKGRSLIALSIACVMQVIGHIVFLLITESTIKNFSPVYVMIWIGIGYSLFAANIWPLLPFVVRGSLLGTGYGMMTSIQNAGLAIFPLIIGQIQQQPSIQDKTTKYTIPVGIFICCAGFALILTVILWIIDLKITGGILNADGKAKKKYKEKLNSPVADYDATQ